MSKAKEVPGVQPSESLVPKVTSSWVLMGMLGGPGIGLVLAGVAMDETEGGPAEEFWFVLVLVFLLAAFVGLVVSIPLIVKLRKAISAANRNIAESLRWQYGFTVDRPKTLILTDKAPVRLNPFDIPATDTYGRPVNIRISPDETGTKVVATICEEHPTPAANHPYERH
ncbi:LapA family protein [Arthrobacter sp. zg-Y1110]|uniref:LapA family protein n=1 Tax=Arthrobacter sp. zg-Y1110 TaxID=2886932 RepID=UPI001D156CFE|nr:LapA family protein [Arthrobacter sp. zg-Y1110]MCC3290916.1 LapA family protein [Arthrobacter sp. zg-Y1110]UWX86330.1 LapA family protein [Arthrobacter sp. zg-Y1110]